MTSLLALAAGRIASAPTAEQDRQDTHRAKVCVMHYLACAIGGATLPWGRAVGDMVAGRPSPSSGGATLVGYARRVGAEDAVFANAVMGQSTLAEDLHHASLTHPGSIVIPAAFAAAEQEGVSGRRFVSAVIVGYDVLCAMGSTFKTPSFAARGFRPSGVFGPLGAAAAAAAVQGLDRERSASALAIAAGTAAGLREWAYAGTTDVYVQNGFAARNGYVAAQLAAHGITGPDSALDGAQGMAHAFLDEEIDWDAAGRRFEGMKGVREVEFKRYPACSAVQAVLELATSIRARHRVSLDSIESVTVYTHHHGVSNPGCDNGGPYQSLGQAQMSNQFGVSLALHGEELQVDSYSRYDDPSFTNLARRITVREDPIYTARYPTARSARIQLHRRDGDIVEELQEATPLSDAEVVPFVRGVLHRRYGQGRVDEIADAMQSLDELNTVEDLLALIREP